MERSVPALVNPELLKWARRYSGLGIQYAANKSEIDVNRLNSWESGRERPTLSQLRRLAKLYRFPIAVFYLPEPPSLKFIQPKDRRFLPGHEFAETSPELNFEFRMVSERREITLELLENISNPPKRFEVTTSLRNSPETLSHQIRQMLSVAMEEQESWREPRLAFNSWRNKLEALNILVFQTTDVPLHQMRGFSLYYSILPVIAVNRSDAYTARSFTLIHELVHLMLKTESVCDMREGEGHLSKADQRMEMFCNSVAGCVLVPRDALLSDDKLEYALDIGPAGDGAIKELSVRFCVSREVIVRRMLSLGLVKENFYALKRAQYQKSLAKRPSSKKGFVHPVTDVLSYAGKPFVGLVLENVNRGNITTADASDYLEVKLRHLNRLQNSVFGA